MERRKLPSLGLPFACFAATQFLGALNDNVFKLLVIFLLISMRTAQTADTVVTSVSALFVLPFLLFSHAGGVLADRFSKRTIILSLKYLEIAIMAAGCAAIALKSQAGLYASLLAMCTQSALFGPSKYGIIPELVPDAALSAANAVTEALTYLAIIIGTFLGSYLLLNWLDGDFLALGRVCVALAVAGTIAAHGIRRTPSAGTQRKLSPAFVFDFLRTIRWMKADVHLSMAAWGSVYFLFLAAFIQQNTILYGCSAMGLDEIRSGYLFPVAALGIATGALVSGKLSGRNIEFGIVPVGAAGLAATCMALARMEASWSNVLSAILSAGFFAGLFIVPLNAFIQHRSPAEKRGEILACVNFFSFLGVAVSAGILFAMISFLKLSPRQCFAAAGMLTAALAVVSCAILPDFLIRFATMILTRCFYRISVHGDENLPSDGGALLVANHVTWMDALLIGSITQRRIRFVMDRSIADLPVIRRLFRLMKTIPVSPSDPPRRIAEALKNARKALDDGYLVCIFAEGAITRNGNMLGFKSGMEHIVRNSKHPIIPVFIGGAWGSIFSYYGGRLFSRPPKRLRYPIWIILGRKLPSSTPARDAEIAVAELSGLWFDLKKDKSRTLGHELIRTCRRNWFKLALAETDGTRLSFGRALAAAALVARRLRNLPADEKCIGVLLPTSAACAVTNMALALSGRTAVNINFTASAEAIRSALRQCSIRTVITSPRFLARLKDPPLPENAVHIEKLLSTPSFAEKIAVLSAALAAPASLLQHIPAGPDDLAAVIFSSGTTGEPKGVMLTHHNIISNIEGFSALIRFDSRDGMASILLFFHSFGYTCCLWCPALNGVPSFLHSNPLEAATVLRMVREHRPTVLLAAPTFLAAYARRGQREDFRSLRLVIAGAEKLRPAVSEAFEKTFGIRPLEGYGATELSPVVSLNLPDVEIGGVKHTGAKEGSIGHPIPGVAARIVDPDTMEPVPDGQEGLLLVKGPNVMKGYMNNPEAAARVLRDGWYNTGDIACRDRDGFLYIRDRLSRYSKIGGEMVPHIAVEEQYLRALGGAVGVLAVTSAPDESKGEQLVVFHTPRPDRPRTFTASFQAPTYPTSGSQKRRTMS